MFSTDLTILKYPRTRHLGDSCLQQGDDGSDRMPFAELQGERVVYEEKVDGANSGFRFDGGGRLHMQSRGRFLNVDDRNAPRERDWTLMKDWLKAHEDEFLDRFEDRYTVYGEWMGIVHTVFYNALPHLFLEFDIFDHAEDRFLDTTSRRQLIEGLPICSVPVLYDGPAQTLDHMKSLIGPSAYRADDEDWRDSLRHACALVGDDFEARLAKMDGSEQIEGIYVKVERDGSVVDRLKWVRHGFLQTIMAADEHWQSRFPVPNLLERQTDVFPPYLARKFESPRLRMRP